MRRQPRPACAGAEPPDPGIDGSGLDELADDVDRLDIPVVAGLATHRHSDHLLWHSWFGEVPRYAPRACAQTAAIVGGSGGILLSPAGGGPG